MDLNVWADERVDATRLKRLGVGYVLALGVLAAAIAALANAAAPPSPEEEALDVELVAAPEPEPEPEPENEPPPPPEPEPEPEPMAAAQDEPEVYPGPDPLSAPTAIPTEAPKEGKGNNGRSSGDDPFDRPGSGGGGGPRRRGGDKPQKSAEKAGPKGKPRANKPLRLTKDMTPPVPVSQPGPGYPSSAKDAGIEGTVVVQFVVTENGGVSNVRAVRGPSELRGVCEAAVRGWRFKPALLDGRPVTVSRTAQFPFRLRS
jgi:protein TonB